MAQGSRIEWTEATWNPVAGCTPVSPGCLNCYAARMALRLEHMPGSTGKKYKGTAKRAKDGRPVFSGNITLDESALDLPRSWRLGRIIFVNSMSDLFHDAVPLEYIQRVFKVMEDCPQHTFQVLTKRPNRARDLAADLPWPKNVWMGTSVESDKYFDRIRVLKRIPAKVRFLSCEPLLGPLKRMPLAGIHWVIVGGESGPGARPMEAEWVHDIKDQCEARGVPFFFKQWGGVRKHDTGRTLGGRTWDQLPVDADAVGGSRCHTSKMLDSSTRRGAGPREKTASSSRT
ncbi:MAG: phage Gp37/Gp68 family protein [Phycisphaeraceae bacterium]|nr:phage Gp37/Gp68 family protein [Phycisphaeraceae bacterium]